MGSKHAVSDVRMPSGAGTYHRNDGFLPLYLPADAALF